MFALREYQQQSVDAIREAFRAGFKRPVFVAPTGSGKTVTFCYIAHGAVTKGNRIFILVHRAELIRQTSEALKEMGLPHGVIAANYPMNFMHQIQIASVQTLVRRLDVCPIPDLVIVDECHHSTSSSYKTILAHYPDSRTLGTTATPSRLDGRGLGEIFDSIVIGPKVRTLIDDGFLARPVYYAPPNGLSMEGVHKIGGDFNRHEIEERMDVPKITGSAVEHYTRLSPGKPAIAFCTSLAHAAHVRDSFIAAGYRSELIEGKMTAEVRARRISDLANGNIHVLTSVDLIGEGIDVPVVETAILLRPTASLALHLQQIGRILRPAPGKLRATVADHVGNCLRHGLAEDPREWSLEGRAAGKRKSAADGVIPLKTCPQCYAVARPSPRCAHCGFIFPIEGRQVKQVDGQLVELTSSPSSGGMSPEQLASRRSQGMAKDRQALEAIARQRGYRPKWVDYILRARGKTGTTAPVSETVTISEMMGSPSIQVREAVLAEIDDEMANDVAHGRADVLELTPAAAGEEPDLPFP